MLILLVAALVVPAVAASSPGEEREKGETRVRASCSGGAISTIRLRSEGRRIRIDFALELDDRSRSGSWRVVILHERRLVARATLPAARRKSLELRRTVANWFGADTVASRATGPRGESCRLSATL